MHLFLQIGTIFVIATILAFLMKVFRQPFVVGYILAGIVAGPHVLNVIYSAETVELLSKIGIVSLLFIVGVSLNPHVIREVGKVSLVTGVGQVVLTSIGGYFLARLLGIEAVNSVYIGIALTFSSTIIILKLLADKSDLNKLYGKIAIGFLLVQDIIATVILVAIATLSHTGSESIGTVAVVLFLKAVSLSAILYICARYILPQLSKLFASSQELLFLFSVTWGISVAGVFYVLGFSAEIGALVAGVTLSVSPFAYEISSRMKPLRDFFIVLFFVFLGSQISFDHIISLAVPAVIFSLFVLIGNPLIMYVLVNLLGYRRRTAFEVSLTVAQISEFSLIVVTLGFQLGQVTQETLSLVTLVGLITISASSYLILNSDRIYPRVMHLLRFLELRKTGVIARSEQTSPEKSVEMLLFGYDRVGEHFVSAFEHIGKEYMVVDFNPKSIERMKRKEIRHRFGDAEDIEFLDELPLSKVKLIVSTIPEFQVNRVLTEYFHKRHPEAIIMVISHNIEDTKELYHAGASYVIVPHYLGASFAAGLIKKHGIRLSKFIAEREKQSQILYT